MLACAALVLCAGVLVRPAAANVEIGTVRVASGLNRPVSIAHAPGDENRLFVVEKPGRIRIVNLQNGVVDATPFLDITSLVGGGTSQHDERGLLGLAFHPDYANNGYFYVNYYSTSNQTVVRRYKVSANPDVADANSALTLLTIAQPASNHNGGWLAFGPNDGYLYIATGDGGGAGDQGNNAQNPNNLLGAILRIDVDNPDQGLNYGIPSDNPFVGKNGRDEIWAWGLRNPWRNGFDRLTGDLFIGDVGQNSWEEINFQPASSGGGENYGWRCYEGNANYNTSGCGPKSDYVFPFHVYPLGGQPECAVVSGYVYRGQDIPGLQGTYFFGDYCSAKIWSLRYDGGQISEFGNRTAQLSPSQDGHVISWITSFGEDARGELYIASQPSSANAGAIFKIVSTAPPTPENDDCFSAIAVVDGQAVFTNVGATTDGPNEPEHCNFFGDTNIQADVWFSYTASCTGDLTVDLCSSDFAAKLGIYGASCPTDSGQIIACNAAACSIRAKLTIPVMAGEMYLLRVGGHQGATGQIVMDISCEAGEGCLGDVNGDQVVDVADMLAVLGSWGQCRPVGACPGDLNSDGMVDVSDLLMVLSTWGACD